MSPIVYYPRIETNQLRSLLAGWRARYPESGALVLLPEAEAARLPMLQAVCRESSVPLVGALFPALIQNAAFVTQGIWLLRLDRMPPVGLLAEINAPGGDPAERMAAVIATQLTEDRSTLLMVFDTMILNIASILDGLYLQLADRVRYVGVSAGSETFQPMPCLFDQDRLVNNGVLWLLLSEELTAIIEHGYQAPAKMLTATSTEGNRIISIDWRPAFTVYQELLQTQYGIALSTDNFYAHAIHFPFGILRANNEVIVRIPVAVEADGSVFCTGEIPANAILTLLEASQIDSGYTVNHIVQSLTELHGSMTDRTLLTFYCAGRRLHLGSGAQVELVDLSAKTTVACLAGALSLGEIGNSCEWGYPLFHNAALVCMDWPA